MTTMAMAMHASKRIAAKKHRQVVVVVPAFCWREKKARRALV